ncbi:MAG: DUF2782 domain-containing protein [Nitrosomonas sp.]|nr:MAG: DUF2782 domain-containing protein [Nitrosomonas sp.]
MHLHRLIITLLLSIALPLMAESEPPKQTRKPNHPDNLIPLPEIPEPPRDLDEPPKNPVDMQVDSEQIPETEVTIIHRGQDIIEEHRINGELLMIKVIPRIGPPYYLKKNMIRDHHNHPNEAGIDVSPPMWQLLQF